MAWQVKQHYIDKTIAHDVIHLHEPRSGAEHVAQIIIGHEGCPLCGTVFPKTNLGEIDRQQHIADTIRNLEISHANCDEWARKHGIPIMGADGKAR